MVPNECRNCKAEKGKQIIHAEFVFGGRENHNFWECNECGLVYLYPIPTEEEEQIFYAKEFEKFMGKRSGSDRDWSGPEAHIKTNQDNVKRRMKFLDDHIQHGNNILEIGCSSGFMLEAFIKAGLNPIGIEPSGGFEQYLEDKGYTCFKSIDEMTRTIPNVKFDLIVHFFVLEHIRNTQKFIEQQLSLLNPGGIIIAEVPCINDPLTSVYNIPAFERFYWSIAHHYYYNPKSLSYVLDKIGCNYKFVPEQRYDLSNHLVWMQEGRPGGQGKYSHWFSKETLESYSNDLKASWQCDTFFLFINK